MKWFSFQPTDIKSLKLSKDWIKISHPLIGPKHQVDFSIFRFPEQITNLPLKKWDCEWISSSLVDSYVLKWRKIIPEEIPKNIQISEDDLLWFLAKKTTISTQYYLT